MESLYNSKSGQKFGYIVVVNKGEKGYVGGFLCADENGVPIEFWHTTESPIKTNRIQELLYGATLKPELLGRHITGSLLSDEHGKPRVRLPVLFTEEEAILRGFDVAGTAVVLIQRADSNFGPDDVPTCRRIVTASGEVVIRWRQEATAEVEQLIPRVESVEVLEPFERIRVLLDELSKK
ncbi:MAG: hypothetical protein HY788_23720 [Deltaproteobacteria bacterium]|nr:hypothetical protein [Deltaproteobacteria bacterium]